MVIGKIIDSSELMHWKQEGKVENVCTAVKKWEKEWYENGLEYSNAIVHAFQKFKAPFSGKIVHIFPEQSAVI